MNSVGKFLGTLMESRTQAHVFHLQTTSFAQHKALQGYYEGIIPLIDAYAEACQGKYGTIRGYQMSTPLIEAPERIPQYFDRLCEFVDLVSQELPDDSFLVNIEDEIKTLLNSTKYLLTLS